MEKITVVAATDKEYAQHMTVMFVSLLENISAKYFVDIYVIDGGIILQDKKRIYLSLSKYKCKVKFISIKPEVYKNFPETPSRSYATYFRLFIPELLDKSIHKVIYLDCDIVVNGNIGELWEIDLNKYLLAAIEDYGINRSVKFSNSLKINLGMNIENIYFNAGVLVINLTKWRENHLTNRVQEFLIKNYDSIIFADQDGLNAVIGEEWLLLDPKWNQQVTYFELINNKKILTDDLINAVKEPKIIHYTVGYYTKTKPWDYLDMHKFKGEYYKYISLTEWKGFVPVNKNFKNMILKFIYKIFIWRILYKFYAMYKTRSISKYKKPNTDKHCMPIEKEIEKRIPLLQTSDERNI
jgi:lipopolysaccharide biosynthesis glycosyltransferase